MKCVHCKRSRQKLDENGYCIDYDDCIKHKPLAGTREETR